MLPAANFHHAVEDVWNAGCTFDMKFPSLTGRKARDEKGPRAKKLLAEYYPDAFWCDKATLVHGGWRACAWIH
jgi:hypothetical protein